MAQARGGANTILRRKTRGAWPTIPYLHEENRLHPLNGNPALARGLHRQVQELAHGELGDVQECEGGEHLPLSKQRRF